MTSSIPSPTIFTSVINSYLPEPHASLLNGILFGVPLRTTKELYNNLKVTGLLHIVVLSGMNITILASIIGLITRFLPKILSLTICLLGIITFVLFVGAEPPIVRAGIMSVLSLFAVVTGRKAIPLYLLFVSLVLILFFSPQWVLSISFQLSYGATFGIILFTQKVASSKSGFKAVILNELRPSPAAQVFTAPLLGFYFHQVSLISPLSNILVAWVIAPLMIFGFLTCVLGKLHVILGVIPSLISFGLLSYLLFVIENLAKVPFSSVSW